jgi:diguanylate cyclase (GGDEF)-like protein
VLPEPTHLVSHTTEASYLLVTPSRQVLRAVGQFGNGLSQPQPGTVLDESFAFLSHYLTTSKPLYLPRVQLQRDRYFDVHVMPVLEAVWVIFLDVTATIKPAKASDRSVRLLIGLNVGVFTYREGLTLQTPHPTWVTELYPEALAPLWRPHATTYLGSFLREARSFWRTPSETPLQSEVWTETTDAKEDITLKATALVLGGEAFLVLERASNNYLQLREALQRSHHNHLEQHRIEQVLLKQLGEVVKEHEQLEHLALVDDLTGLYNRRGFFYLARRHLETTHVPLLVLYIDMDNLKTINDTLGHAYGDKAIVKMGEALKKVFRGSDIVARLGGDEFVVLAVGATEQTLQAMLERLSNILTDYHAQDDIAFPLSASIGVIGQDPSKPMSLEALLEEADRNMYEEKVQRRKGRSLTVKS